MNLFKRNNTPALRSNRPQDPFALMNELMSNIWSEGNTVKEFSPSIEVKESKTDYRVMAELPGMNKEDVDVHFEGNTLYMKGEKRTHRENNEDERIHYSERYYGSFMRAIPFGDEVDTSKIDAEFNNGVLTVKLTKKPFDKPQTSRISIR